jgi:hypothetical protein
MAFRKVLMLPQGWSIISHMTLVSLFWDVDGVVHEMQSNLLCI